MRGRNVLTHSRMQCAKTCLRKHHLRYNLGLRPKQTTRPLRRGSAFHLAQEMADQLERQDESISLNDLLDLTEGHIRTTYSDNYAQAQTEEFIRDLRYECEIVVSLFRGHRWYWKAVDRGQFQRQENPPKVRRVIETESAFELPITNPATGAQTPVYRVAGKLDRIVELLDTRVALQEYKTASQDIANGSNYWKRLRIDSQVSLYVWAARQLGHPVVTILYDVTRWPGIRPKQIPELDANKMRIVLDGAGNRVFNKNGTPKQSGDAEKGYTLQTRIETPQEFAKRLREDLFTRPEYYYARQEIPRLEADLEEFRTELWQQQKLLRECELSGRHYRNSGACLVYGTPCEYFDFCSENRNLDELVSQPPDGFEIVEYIHPELKPQEEEGSE
jgi:hypothetical protein